MVAINFSFHDENYQDILIFHEFLARKMPISGLSMTFFSTAEACGIRGSVVVNKVIILLPYILLWAMPITRYWTINFIDKD